MTYQYKSRAVLRDIVLKSAMFAFVAGLAINVPVAVVLITTNVMTGCYDASEYRRALVMLPVIHMMVFVVVFLLMCAMFVIMARYDDQPKN